MRSCAAVLLRKSTPKWRGKCPGIRVAVFPLTSYWHCLTPGTAEVVASELCPQKHEDFFHMAVLEQTLSLPTWIVLVSFCVPVDKFTLSSIQILPWFYCAAISSFHMSSTLDHAAWQRFALSARSGRAAFIKRGIIVSLNTLSLCLTSKRPFLCG